jgi:hypothetical protein
MFPTLGLHEPLPLLIGMQDGLLAAQERHRAATLSVFHQFLPDRFLMPAFAYPTIVREVLQLRNLSDRRRAALADFGADNPEHTARERTTSGDGITGAAPDDPSCQLVLRTDWRLPQG